MIAIADILPILLALVLAWAGMLNLAAPDFIRDEFKAWGYSDRLRLLVGALELIASAALLIAPLRLIGYLIATTIVLGVLFTLLRQRLFMRLEYPLLLLALLLIAAQGTLTQGTAQVIHDGNAGVAKIYD